MNLKTREDHKREAQKWLSAARGQGRTDECIENMHKYLELGNFTLADIGTSEEDLRKVLLKKAA